MLLQLNQVRMLSQFYDLFSDITFKKGIVFTFQFRLQDRCSSKQS